MLLAGIIVVASIVGSRMGSRDLIVIHPGDSQTFTSIRVFDGERILERQTVVVDSGRFVRVGAEGLGEYNADKSQILEGVGMTMLPGFIDAHVHLGFFDPKRVLQGGITTARDTGWPATKIFPLARRLATDPKAGPFLLASGPMITAPGGYPLSAGWAPQGTALEVTTAQDGREAVKRLKAQGATLIKVAQESRQGPVLPLDVLSEVVKQAHELGLKVTSHLGSLDQLEVALDAGVDELAHGLWSDEVIPDATIARMVQAGMTVIPTLHIDPSRQRIDNLKRFLSAGGKVIYGTDMGNSGPPPGIDVAELKLMMDAGMSASETLTSATAGAADYLGLKHRGRISVGYIADLIVVKGNPLEDLRVLNKPLLIMRQARAAG